jgi:hypothetical protein
MPQRTENQTRYRLQKLASDDRLFCAELVGCVLKVHNEVNLRRPYHSLATREWAAEAETAGRALDWVPQVNRMRVRAGGFQESEQTIWERPGHNGNNVIKAMARVLEFFMTIDPDPSRPIFTAADFLSPKAEWDDFWHRPNTKHTFARWINEQLAQFNEWTKLQLQNGAIISTSLVQLNTVERCVAYALALLIQNRHGLMERVRICPFFGRDFAKPHYFLDFRLESDGKLARGEPQTYCTPRHANADRQRRRRLA